MVLPWDKLVRLAMVGYDDLVSGLFSRLLRIDSLPDPDKALNFELTGSFDDDFAAVLADMGMASYLNGMADPLASITIKDIPVIQSWRADYWKSIENKPRSWIWDGVNFPSKTPSWRPVTEKAVSTIKKWNLMTREQFDLLSRQERSNAWTITKVNTKKSLQKIRDSIAESLTSGTSQVKWYRQIKKEFDKSNLGPASASLVYRVASTKAWHEGIDRTLSNRVIGDLMPYVRVVTINDTRRTLACTMMTTGGIQKSDIYRRDDPAYLDNRTPRHFNCRCRDVPLTVRQAARMGIEEAIAWLKTGVEPTKPERVPYFRVPMPKGWIPLAVA